MREDSPAQELFRKIKLAGVSYINDAISNKSVETYYLDFKITEKADYTGQRKLFDSDKKNYAKSISAFGNSEGGVIIWGVGTGKGDIDYANTVQPITNVSGFQSKLEGFTSLLTSPPHISVVHQIIFTNEINDTGYLVTFIPKSNRRPLQSIYNNENTYYIRAGSSSVSAPHTFLKSLFGQEPQSDVIMVFGVSPAKLVANVLHVEVGLILHNRGENIAENINGYAHVFGKNQTIEIQDQRNFDYFKNSMEGMKISFTAKREFLLGIEQEIQPIVFKLQIENPVSTAFQVRLLVNGKNQPSHRMEKFLTKEDLQKIYDAYLADNSFEVGGALFESNEEETIEK